MSQIAGEPATQDFVEVRLPAAGAYLSVLRTATAGLAARLDFTLDEIEDLRIAVDEACAILLQQAVPGSVLSCVFRLVDDSLEVTVSAPTTDGHAPRGTPSPGPCCPPWRARSPPRWTRTTPFRSASTNSAARDPGRREERGRAGAGRRARHTGAAGRGHTCRQRGPPHGGRHRRHPRAGPAASGGRGPARGRRPGRRAADRGRHPRPARPSGGEGSGKGNGRDDERARATLRGRGAGRAGHAEHAARPAGPQRGTPPLRRAAHPGEGQPGVRGAAQPAGPHAPPLVEHLARRFRNRGEPLDDLTQVATIGLIKSVDRFDPDRGVEFSTYATPTVVGEIKRHFRDKGWAVRVPRRLQELRLALTTATAELSQLHGRSPPSTSSPRSWQSPRRRSWRAWSRPTPTPRCPWTSRTPTTSPRRSRTPSGPRTRRWRVSSTGSRSSRCWRICRRGRSGSCCCASSAT